MKLFTRLLAPLAASALMIGSAHAALIGTITHDYGSSGHAGSASSTGSCDTLNSSSVTIRNTSGCQRFFDAFDFSHLAYDSIDSFSLNVTFSDTADYSLFMGFIPYNVEQWRVRPASSAVAGSGLNNSSVNVERSPNMATNTYTFDDSLDVFGDILAGEAFYLWFNHSGSGSHNFNLYTASLEVFGTPQAAVAVPEPAMLGLMSLGLLGLAYTRRRRES